MTYGIHGCRGKKADRIDGREHGDKFILLIRLVIDGVGRYKEEGLAAIGPARPDDLMKGFSKCSLCLLTFLLCQIHSWSVIGT